jgi:hypothetical protein
MAKLLKVENRSIIKKRAKVSRSGIMRFKKWVTALFSGMLIWLITQPASAADYDIKWQRSDIGIDDGKLYSICLIQNAQQVIYTTSKKAIYKSVDSGKTWYRVFMLRGQDQNINYITYAPPDSYRIFAAASNGLYMSTNGGKDWRRVFKGRDRLQGCVNYVTVDADHYNIIFLGTEKGLFQSDDAAKNWKAHPTFANKKIRAILLSDNYVYVCAEDGLYMSKKNLDAWERVYVVAEPQEKDQKADNDENDEIGSIYNILNHICIDKDKIYIASNKGPLILEDGSRTPGNFETKNLLSKKIKFILPYSNNLFAATDKGLFLYDSEEKGWIDKTAGIDSCCINGIAIASDQDRIFVATEKGVFSGELKEKPRPVEKKDQETDIKSGILKYDIKNVILKEPTINQIQRAAIKYAEVAPEKIELMRSAARNKAILPEVSIGLNGDMDRSLHVDTGSTTAADFYIEGPKAKGWGWDVNASWDLGEIIWNDDQTNIDVRSRLMVQLRNDILDEVTKLYFERRRLQIELYNNPPKSEKEAMFKQLRMDELTANIDSLTGGFLSESIKARQ